MYVLRYFDDQTTMVITSHVRRKVLSHQIINAFAYIEYRCACTICIYIFPLLNMRLDKDFTEASSCHYFLSHAIETLVLAKCSVSLATISHVVEEK